jgi:hypothetical protein
MCDVHGDDEKYSFLSPRVSSDRCAPQDVRALGLHILCNDMHKAEVYRRKLSKMLTGFGLKFVKIDRRSDSRRCDIEFKSASDRTEVYPLLSTDFDMDSSNSQVLLHQPDKAYKRILRKDRMKLLAFMCAIHGDQDNYFFSILRICNGIGAPRDITAFGIHILLHDMHEEYEDYRQTLSAVMPRFGLKLVNIDRKWGCNIEFERLSDGVQVQHVLPMTEATSQATLCLPDEANRDSL